MIRLTVEIILEKPVDSRRFGGNYLLSAVILYKKDNFTIKQKNNYCIKNTPYFTK